MRPYFADDLVTLWLGDCREVLPTLGVTADLMLADPPYGETSLAWDRWPDGWLDTAAGVTSSLWCFGSLRMFMAQRDEFAGWKFSQDVVWSKPMGTSMSADRFSRSHETVTHWYRGDWRSVHHMAPRVAWSGPKGTMTGTGSRRGSHLSDGARAQWVDDGTRLAFSVLACRSMYKRAIHPTEKPLGILDPLITYACPPGGLVIDPFAGSGSTLDAARASGRRAIGIEADERYAEAAARRLSQGVMALEMGAG